MDAESHRRQAPLLRRGLTLVELLIILAIIFILAQIVIPSFWAARARANQRACYANQKTIAGVMEMYGLDPSPEELTGHGDYAVYLRKKGYLKEPLPDPGFDATSAGNYRFTTEGDIYCANHGPIQTSLPWTMDTTAPRR